MGFREMLARFINGELQRDQIPAVAMQAIEDGYDSPSLRQLAVMEDADPKRVSALLSQALDELQIRLPSSKPFVIVRRYPYEEPYHTQLEIIATNGSFAGVTDVYCAVDEIRKIGRTLKTFPTKLGDEYKFEYGSPDRSARCYRHFILRAYTIDRVGHCA